MALFFFSIQMRIQCDENEEQWTRNSGGDAKITVHAPLFLTFLYTELIVIDDSKVKKKKHDKNVLFPLPKLSKSDDDFAKPFFFWPRHFFIHCNSSKSIRNMVSAEKLYVTQRGSSRRKYYLRFRHRIDDFNQTEFCLIEHLTITEMFTITQ